ncbi:hypothetical protein HNQ62_000399 [Sulfurisphaera ohwakuensis]|uniref:Uncharacterized protein n=1 Tax=Sulfurisphaera ohwakuensis TaxID=69656 RepID=A0A7J9RPD4_SULOH|nr:hypothetical protein [Sulfurisphaera ohwakuensis]
MNQDNKVLNKRASFLLILISYNLSKWKYLNKVN